jgi:metal-responsive CopG/Arc/MetJ family transcriptional regulator
MQRQNVTLSLPKSLLKKAKVLAAKKEKSLSQILKEAIQEKVKSYRIAAMKRQGNDS